VVVGTPDYIAPEQARGEPIDERVDIYALGGTLYFLLTGKPPFRTGVPAEDKYLKVVARHLRQPPPDAREKQPGVDPELAELARLMMSKKPAERPRYPELLERLATIADRLGGGDSGRARTRSGARPATGALGVGPVSGSRAVTTPSAPTAPTASDDRTVPAPRVGLDDGDANAPRSVSRRPSYSGGQRRLDRRHHDRPAAGPGVDAPAARADRARRGRADRRRGGLPGAPACRRPGPRPGPSWLRAGQRGQRRRPRQQRRHRERRRVGCNPPAPAHPGRARGHGASARRRWQAGVLRRRRAGTRARLRGDVRVAQGRQGHGGQAGHRRVLRGARSYAQTKGGRLLTSAEYDRALATPGVLPPPAGVFEWIDQGWRAGRRRPGGAGGRQARDAHRQGP
jgi:hypothetical protein